MQITLFSGFSKEHNSTKQPTGGTAVNCYLKDDTSLINPVFILDSADFSVNYVQWGSRYYFVDDVVSIRNSAVELHCSVDALASWKTAIGASSQYVTRSASQYDEGIIDNLYPARVFETIADTTVDLNLTSALAQANYVVGVINKASDASGGITYYAMSPQIFADLLSFLYGGTWLNAPATEVSVELQKELVNPFQYIAFIMSFPYDIVSGLVQKEVKFGYWASGVFAGVITSDARYLNIISGAELPDHPQAGTRGIYMNASPYTRRVLHCYGFGDIALDSIDFIHNKRINLSLQVDKYNGTGKLEISNNGDATLHRTLFGQIGINVPISQITANVNGNPVSMLLNDFKAGFSNFYQGATRGSEGSIGNAVSGLLPSVQTQGQQGSGVYYTHAPHVTSKFLNLVPIDVERNGRPLMQTKLLNTLSGFTQIENPDVDIPATTQEKDIIAGYMRSGFYYE